jgi:dienelactone hydrolase
MKNWFFAFAFTFCALNQSIAQTWSEAEQKLFAYNAMKWIANGELDTLMVSFDSTMRRKLNKVILDRVYTGLQMQVGEYVSHSEPTIKKIDTLFRLTVPAKFKRADAELTVTLNSSNQIAGLFLKPVRQTSEYLAPSYSDQLCVGEKKLAIEYADLSLPGVLSVPCQGNKHPIVIFVHGSGPHDMDETIGPNKPFKDLHYQLIKSGIATYRYDKRSKVHPEFFSQKKDYTVQQEVIQDVQQAIKLFGDHPLIDPERIYVLGHSLGAIVGPRIVLSSNVKGLVMMAGTVRPLEDVVLDQYEYLFGLDSILNSEEEKVLMDIKTKVNEVKQIKPRGSASTKPLLLDLPASYWLDLNQNPALRDFKKVKMPILVLHGGRDYQVTAKDLAAIKKASKKRKNIEIKVFNDLNHLFIPGTGISKPQEYMEPGHVPVEVGDAIANWIKSN